MVKRDRCTEVQQSPNLAGRCPVLYTSPDREFHWKCGSTPSDVSILRSEEGDSFFKVNTQMVNPVSRVLDGYAVALGQ